VSSGRIAARGRLGLLMGRRMRRGRARSSLSRRRLALAAGLTAGLLALLGGGWLWLRNSSLVAVQRVTVIGQSGPEAGAIRAALMRSARGMSTLDVQVSQLRMAVSPYPEVKDVQVATHFPHGLSIRVVEQLPVAVVNVGGRPMAVGSDGTLLHQVSSGTSLPVIPLAVPPGGPRLTDPAAKRAVALLAAAPYQLLAKVSQVTTVSGHGLVAQLRDGPSIYFGPPTQLRAKWIAATEVLADPGSVGASYIDVTDPMRPAAGG
jgi:cell division protein FtsQ